MTILSESMAARLSVSFFHQNDAADHAGAIIAPVDGKSYVSGDRSVPLRRATIPQIFAETVSRFGPRDAAIFSQFGAGVADTVGTGGIVEEESRGRIPRRVGYVLVCALAILLIWVADIFQVLTLASRAFALYYALQAIIATVVVHRQSNGPYRRAKLVLFPILAVLLLLVAIFAIPAH